MRVEFSTSKLANRHPRIFRLRRGLADAFAAAARAIKARGWIIRVEDAFRSRLMQKHIALQPRVLDVVVRRVAWETGSAEPDPDLVFRRLTVLTATCPKIGTHMSGSALDISVLRADDGVEVDRGGPYIELSELTPMNSPFVSRTAARNRAEITAIMNDHGFVAYPFEF